MRILTAPDVYSYYSANAFIRDAFEHKKRQISRYSVRAWAKNMGLKSHTRLQSIVNGKGSTPISLLSRLVLNLKLSEQEAHYLLLLINIENSTDQYSRLMLIDQIETLRSHKRFTMTEMADFSILSDPFWGALLEMTDLEGFKTDPAWISRNSVIPKSPEEIEIIIKTLLKHGLLTSEEGQLKKAHPHITNVHDLANLGSMKYHRNVSLLAADQVTSQSVEEREMNGYAMNIRQRDIPKMKQALRKFVKSFIVEFEAVQSVGDSTYQFNTQFFSLMRNR